MIGGPDGLLDRNKSVWQLVFETIRPHVETHEEADRLTRAIHPLAVALRRYKNGDG